MLKYNTFIQIFLFFLEKLFDRAGRHDLKSQLLLFFSPFIFPPKKKREEEKENEQHTVKWRLQYKKRYKEFCQFRLILPIKIYQVESQNFLDPVLALSQVLVLSQVLKIQTWVLYNKTLITQSQVLIFQSYPKTRFLY